MERLNKILTIDDLDCSECIQVRGRNGKLDLSQLEMYNPFSNNLIEGSIRVRELYHLHDEKKINKSSLIYLIEYCTCNSHGRFETYVDDYFIGRGFYIDYKSINEVLKVIQMKFISFCEGFLMAYEINELGNALIYNKKHNSNFKSREEVIKEKFLELKEIIINDSNSKLNNEVSEYAIEIDAIAIEKICLLYDLSAESGFEIQYDRILKRFGTGDERFGSFSEQNEEMVINYIKIINKVNEKLELAKN